MDEEDIQRLFQGVAEHAAQKTEDAQKVFSILAGASLRYRDHVLETSGRVVTVEHVRTALKALIPALATGEAPIMENEISLGLLEIWAEGLAFLGYPRIHSHLAPTDCPHSRKCP